MVRLKESLLVAAASSLYISIPYGSIKRHWRAPERPSSPQFQFLMVRLKARSNTRHVRISAFQFLMVRLKENQGQCLSGHSRPISIPYGSIKREETRIRRFKEDLFQFLMVRLKVLVGFLVEQLRLFQFLMVRLKGSSRFCNLNRR